MKIYKKINLLINYFSVINAHYFRYKNNSFFNIKIAIPLQRQTVKYNLQL